MPWTLSRGQDVAINLKTYSRLPISFQSTCVRHHLQYGTFFRLTYIWLPPYVFRIVPLTVREISLVYSSAQGLHEAAEVYSELHPPVTSFTVMQSPGFRGWGAEFTACTMFKDTLVLHGLRPQHPSGYVCRCPVWLNFYQIYDSFIHVFVEYLSYANH